MHWDPANLIDHYELHPNGDQVLCWQKKVDVRGRSISKAEYESASLKIVSDPWLVYESNDARKGKTSVRYGRSKYFVDSGIFQTITSNNKVMTSFHKHIGTISERSLVADEGKLEFLNHLDHRIQDGRSESVAILQIEDPKSISHLRLKLAVAKAELARRRAL